jgi:hypothetical protein
MPKYCSENERVKRAYTFYLQAASGKQDATIEAALRAIVRFEESTGRKPFGRFTVEQARSFRARLVDEPRPNGKPLSAATITTTLKHLTTSSFGCRASPASGRNSIQMMRTISPLPSKTGVLLARVVKGRPPGLDDIKRVLAAMQSQTHTEKRNRAVVAFAILPGARWRDCLFAPEAR